MTLVLVWTAIALASSVVPYVADKVQASSPRGRATMFFAIQLLGLFVAGGAAVATWRNRTEIRAPLRAAGFVPLVGICVLAVTFVALLATAS